MKAFILLIVLVALSEARTLHTITRDHRYHGVLNTIKVVGNFAERQDVKMECYLCARFISFPGDRCATVETSQIDSRHIGTGCIADSEGRAKKCISALTMRERSDLVENRSYGVNQPFEIDTAALQVRAATGHIRYRWECKFTDVDTFSNDHLGWCSIAQIMSRPNGVTCRNDNVEATFHFTRLDE